MDFPEKNKEKCLEMHEKINQSEQHQGKTRRFFDKIAFLQMTDQGKANIANEILGESYAGKLYWLELVLSSVVATLGLLTNSIPVVIGAMLIAPILAPIKAFSFAVTTGNRHIYFKALKILLLSIVVAVGSSFVITLIVPFADLTTEVMARTSPTIVDLFIALASGIIAILSLGFKKLSESIAWVAMAVALMPPLCVIWVGLQFLNRDVTAGSGLLFLTNLIAIIVVGIIIFYAFGFFPTNKLGQKRSITMSIIIILTITVLTIPLWKAMETIAYNFSTRTEISRTFDSFWPTINSSITIQNFDFQSLDDDTLRVNATLNVPDTLKITNEHKRELTERLAVETQKSVELQINLIGISSVYIEQQEEVSIEKELQKTLYKELQKYPDIVMIELKVAQNNVPLVLLNLFGENKEMFGTIEEQLSRTTKRILGEDAKLLISRQTPRTKKETKEMDKEQKFFRESIEKQFALLMPKEELNHLGIENTEDVLLIDIQFTTSQEEPLIKRYMESRKEIMQKYFQKKVSLHSKVEYISEWDFE